MSGFMLTTSLAAKGLTATNSGSNASTTSTVPPRRSLFAASTTGSKPFLNDTIGTRGAKDDNPFIEPPVRKLFKPSVGLSTVRQGPGGGQATSIFGRSRLLQKSITGKNLSVSTSISSSGPSSTSTEKDSQMGARKNNKQRLVLTRVYPINSSARFSGSSSSNNTSSDPAAVAMETQRPIFNSRATSVPTPTSNSPEEVTNTDQIYSTPLYHHPSTTPKAPPPNKEFYQSLSKVPAPRFPEKTHDNPREKDTSMEMDNILGPSDTLAHDSSQGSILPPTNVMAFARKSIMKHAASSPHSIFRKFDKNKPSADTLPIEPVHSPQEASLETEAPAKLNRSSRTEVDGRSTIAVQLPERRTIQPSDGFFVFQSQPRPDIAAKHTTETKTKPARSRPSIEHPVLSHSVLDFSKQPDPQKKDIPSSAPISTVQYRSKRVDISSELILNSRPTLDPIPPREPQLTPETSTLETDNLAAAQKFDIRAALRTDSARFQYNLPGLTATLTPPSPPSKRSSPYLVPSAHEREGLRFKRLTQFKARPLDPRVFTSAGDLGVPKIAKRPVTVPVSPVFSRRRVKKSVAAGYVNTAAATRLKNVIGAAKAEAHQGAKPILKATAPAQTWEGPQASVPSTSATTSSSHGLKAKSLRRPTVPTRPVPFQFATSELQRKRALFEPTTAEPRRELETFGSSR
ncbi:hypothetical protein BGZ52_011066 [Haplosporangium bisporale]|nr:hypothetical protein BGZ52_011066 [Haplosporangium bisporale]KFH73506.1 hypothetical protein MVEG_00722 [Podila verticillata NRRL 6337]